MKSTVVGLALVNLDSKCKIRPSGFEIERLYVHSSFQNNGIGRAMLSFISDNIGKAFWLYTWTENASNNFYEHVGFRKIGTQDIRFSQQVILNNVYAFVAR
jgi:ribosomal protein S18 acetylase RimI-like enzyme